MKIALGQMNPTVGDIDGNVRKIRAFMDRALHKKADLVIFPELCLTGYPPRDLLEQPRFIEQNRKALEKLAEQTGQMGVLVGFVDINPNRSGKKLYNSAALLHKGRIVGVRHKTLLPTYDVFDEYRYFEPAHQNTPLMLGKTRLGVTICEDMWNDASFWPHRIYTHDPVKALARQKIDILINLSCSPFHRGKSRQRLDLVESHVRQLQKPFVFVNQVGGNDDLVFDGHSFVLGAKGQLIGQGKGFQEDLIIVDSKSVEGVAWKESSDIAEVRDALVLGLRDYTRKCNFKDVLIGLSGGIDSAVTAALAVEALGKKHVLGVSMPSPISSRGSVTDAQELAHKLGIRMISVPINPVYQSFRKSLAATFGKRPTDVTEENLQARIRGTLLMALSNKFGMLLLTTGNKSELSMGYCTLYGDMNGGLAVISDVPKILVYELGRFINHKRIVIPEASFTKPPSAELRPDQTDQDSLPPYEVLDPIIEAYIEHNQDVPEIVQQGYEQKLVEHILNTIDRNEYKRRQAPPGLRITPKAFGSGRRMPIARGNFR